MTNPDDRQRILTQTRNLKMAQSAHAYVRGSTVKFYEWLDSSRRCQFPEGPPVWICGDCHVGNLGPLADAKGHVVVQIRDLDQTVIGNPAHDLIRLGLSLASAARGSDLPGVTTAWILEELVAGYQSGLLSNFETENDKSHRPKSIQTLLAQSTRRRWQHLAEERLDTVKPTIPLGKRFWALTPAERKALSQMFASDMVRPTLTSLRGRAKDDPIELLDAAYWMKGCSSLGRLRYAAILRIGHGKNSKSLPGRRQGRGDRCGPQGAEGGNATGQCDPSGNGRASAFSEPRTAHDVGKASRKISRCSGAYAARPEDRDQSTKPPGSDESGALSSRGRRARARSPNESQPAAGMAIRFGEKPQGFARSPVLVVGERRRAAWFARSCISGPLPTICTV